jgi:soluble lytic murein transglycosylase
LKNTDLMAFRDRLNPREYQQLQRQQQQLLHGQAAANQPVQEVLNQFMREAGINPQPQASDTQGLRTVGHICSAFQQRLTAAEQEQGKPLSFDQQQKLAAHLFTKVGVRGLLFGTQEKPAVLVDSHQDKVVVPAADRQQIIQALQYINPQSDISEDAIFYQYLQQKGLLK